MEQNPRLGRHRERGSIGGRVPRARRWLGALISASCLASPLLVAALPLTAGRPALHTFSVDDGLPQSSIQATAIDRQGRLWIGTQDGAAVYDGREWRAVDLPPGPGSNFVEAILSAADGALWFGTNGGLFRLQDGLWTSFHPADPTQPRGRVQRLGESRTDGRSGLWVGTESGLARLEQDRWSWPEPAAGWDVRALLGTEGPNGPTLWVGTSAGLGRFRDGSWTLFEPGQSGLPGKPVTSLAVSRGEPGSTLWVGTGAGVTGIRGEQWIHPLPALDGEEISALTVVGEGSDAELWIGTGSGLARFRNGRLSRYDATTSALPSDLVMTLLASGDDEEPVLWIGTADGGLARLLPAGWESFDGTNTGLPRNCVHAIVETGPADRPTLWFGTEDGGLAAAREGRWTVYRAGESGLPDDTVNTLRSARHGDGLWIATEGGLAFFERGNWTVYDSNNSPLPDDGVVGLHESADGTLWVGTNGGLARLSEGRWTVFDPSNSPLPDDSVHALLETAGPAGPILWIGTTSGGLARLENGSWRLFQAANSPLPHNWVNALLETHGPEGRFLWIATDGGLARLDPLAPDVPWLVITDDTEPALPNRVAYSLAEDAYGRIYSATNRGVARIDPAGAGSADPLTVAVFTAEDGLASLEGNQGAAWRDRHDAIWVGTVDGVSVLRPRPPGAAVPPIAILGVSTPGGPRIARPGLVLAPSDNTVIFEYAVASLVGQSASCYRVQLEGLDARPGAWISAVRMQYERLPAGRYVFRVWGRDHRGRVSGPAELAFSIRQAAWKSGGAMALYALLALVTVYGSVTLRARALHRRNDRLEAAIRERTRDLAEAVRQREESERLALRAKEEAEAANRAKSAFLATMSHELRTPMNAVIGMASLLMETNPTEQQQEYVETIRSGGEALLAVINDILDFSKVESGRLDLEQRPFEVRRLVEEVLELEAADAFGKGLDFGYWLEASVPPRVIGDPARVLQILINLVANGVKFTESGEVFVTVAAAGDTLRFAVRDTGIGIPADQLERIFDPFTQADSSTTRRFGGSGLGLAITRRLVEAMGGRIAGESEQGRGTTFRFSIRAPRAQDPPTGDHPAAAGRILVVSPSQTTRRTLSGQLKALGYTADPRSSAADALAAVEEAPPPRAAIVDARLTGCDGCSAQLAGAGVPSILANQGLRPSVADPPAPGVVARIPQPVRLDHLSQILSPITGEAATGATRAAAAAGVAPLRILVAEDNPVNQVVVRKMLTTLGQQVDMVPNGREALAAVLCRRYDLAILDLRMPEMDGLEAARRICAQIDPARRPRLAALTATALEADREASRKAGFADFLAKPVDLDDLRELLKRCWTGT